MSENNFNILIVDDSLLSLNHLKRILIKQGYIVETASSGEEAVKKAPEISPDLILLDITMPGMDGFDVIKWLKENKDTHSIPVIFLTGNDDQDTKIKAFDLGAVDYIVKPFHPQEVKARVKVHLKLGVGTKSIIEAQKAKLEQVKEAQFSILVKPEDMPEAHFAVYYNSLLEAGGDFYDVLKVADDLFTCFVADVSGHDIATSYISPAVKALLKQNSSPIYTAVETVGMMNNVLAETLPPDKYLTAFYLSINKKSKTATYINAGHPPAIYIPVNGEPEILNAEGDLIGMFEDAYYQSKEIMINKGDKFILYTDGLLETAGSEKVWSTEFEKLLPVAEEFRNLDIGSFPAKLLEMMIGQEKEIDDDIIIFAIEV